MSRRRYKHLAMLLRTVLGVAVAFGVALSEQQIGALILAFEALGLVIYAESNTRRR